jgi:hypothetical protein
MSIANTMHAESSSDRPPGCPFQTALGTLITIDRTTITSAIERRIPISMAGFYVRPKVNSSSNCVPARRAPTAENRPGLRPYSPSPETTWACDRDATKDTPAKAYPREVPFSYVTSTRDTAETANIGAAGVDLGNGRLDAGN